LTPAILERMRTSKVELRAALEQLQTTPETGPETAGNDSAISAKRPAAMLSEGEAKICNKAPRASDKGAKSTVALTPEEEEKLCRWIEQDKGLPAGSIALYPPEDLPELVKLWGGPWPPGAPSQSPKETRL